MTTSGTYDFNPTLTQCIILAYARCGVRRTAITAEHLDDARLESNMLLAEFANRGPNLWKIGVEETILSQGVATYDIPARVVMVLDATIRTTTGDQTTDRVIQPVSRSEYASYPNKDTQGSPSIFWFDRSASPTLTLWQVPDSDNTYVLRYYAYSQMEDATQGGGATLDLPYRFLDAFVAGLSARLAAIYATDRLQANLTAAEKAWTIASTQDVENTPLYLTPSLSSYFR